MHRGFFLGGGAWLAWVLVLVPQTIGAKPRVPPFAVVLHVASADPAAARAWFDRQLVRANEHFAAAGVAFVVHRQRALPASFATVETIRERVRLKRHFVQRSINVFLVDQILDPYPSRSTRRAASRAGFKPSGQLAGAHIRVRGRKKRRPGTYLLICHHCGKLVVTHELGHFFWLPHHKKDPANIMSYGHKRIRFSQRQLKHVRAHARRYRRGRHVRTVPSTAARRSPGGS